MLLFSSRTTIKKTSFCDLLFLVVVVTSLVQVSFVKCQLPLGGALLPGLMQGAAAGLPSLLQGAASIFHNTLRDLFTNDQVKDGIIAFLDAIPSSHVSRSAADRCFIADRIAGWFHHNKTKKTEHHEKHEDSTTTIHKKKKKKNDGKGHHHHHHHHHPTSDRVHRPNRRIPHNDYRKNADSYNNKVIEVIGQVFALREAKCGKETCGCGKIKKKCVARSDCKPAECRNKCAPCPLPQYCMPPKEGQKCPPKPVCPVCKRDQVHQQASTLAPRTTTKVPTTTKTTTTTTSSTTTTTTTGKPATTSMEPDTTTTMMPATNDTTTTPPEIRKELKVLLEIERQHFEARISELEAKQKACKCTAIGTKKPCRKPHHQHNIQQQQQQHHHHHHNDKRRPHTLEALPGRMRPPNYHDGEPKSTTRPMTTMHPTTTMGPSASDKKNGTLIMDISHSSNSSSESSSYYHEHHDGANNHFMESYNSSSSSSSSSSSKHFVLQGEFLFEKNIHILVKNESMRSEIIRMIEMTPIKTGGPAMALAHQVLNKLGDRPPPPVMGKRGVQRAFSYVNSRVCLKAVVGHILEEFLRKECKCSDCDDGLRICDECPHQTVYCDRVFRRCRPCPRNPICPAPEKCPTYPPCKDCRMYDIEDPDFDGLNPKELDDVDLVNVVEKNEVIEASCDSANAKKRPTCQYTQTCGVADLNPLTPRKQNTGYMVGGEDEVYGEWPHFARIDIRMPTGMNGICGGALISDKHVLTAGHCVSIPTPGSKNYTRLKPNMFRVLLADHDRDQKDKFEVERKVDSICFSSKFNDPKGEGSRYDFAVLTLDKPVPFNEHIQPACLPREPLDPMKSKCFVIGLGVTKWDKANGAHMFAQKIQKMPLKRVSCKDWGIRHDDRSRHCFTKSGAMGDTCGGDSGGPVMCLNHRRRWTINGLVSYGSETCDGSESTGWVAVYTRVHELMDRIIQDCSI